MEMSYGFHIPKWLKGEKQKREDCEDKRMRERGGGLCEEKRMREGERVRRKKESRE